MASPRWISLIVLSASALLNAGCGVADPSATARSPELPEQPSFHPVETDEPSVEAREFTAADAKKIKSIIRSDRAFRRIVKGAHPRITDVIPYVSEGRRHLIGRVVKVSLHPPIDIQNAVVPTRLVPGYKAPPGTPTLHRFVRFSAIGIPELMVRFALRSERVFSIAPEGGGELTKGELLGPPIKHPSFYGSDPGY